MKKSLIILFCTCFCLQATMAQSKLTLENVKSVYLRNSGAILESNEVKGYYIYYVSDNVSRKTNEYTIKILDENLKELRQIVFEDKKDEQLLETSYNSSSLLFLFLNKSAKTVTSKIYGLDGKLIATYVKDLDRRSLEYFVSRANLIVSKDDAGSNTYLFDLENKGYISLIPLRDGKEYSFEINVYRSDKKKQASYTPNDGEYKVQSASFLGATDSIAVFEVLKKERLLSNKIQASVIALDINTGKKLFEFNPEKAKYNFMPMTVTALQSTGQMLVLGTYYDKGDKLMKDNTLGIAALLLDRDGNVLGEKYNSWQKDFRKYFNVSSSGKIDDVGFLYFHKIVQMENGEIFAVGEGYKRTASAGGIALTVLNAAAGGGVGASSVTQLNITDLIIIKFGNDFSVKEVKTYEKNKNKFAIPGGDFQSPHTMAVVAKSMGAYDYEFTRTDKFNTSFFVGFNDYEKGKSYKGMVFHGISYVDGKLTRDRINLVSSASSMRVLPAKPGSILISEYFKKAKKIEFRLEKIN